MQVKERLIKTIECPEHLVGERFDKLCKHLDAGLGVRVLIDLGTYSIATKGCKESKQYENALIEKYGDRLEFLENFGNCYILNQID